MATLDSIGTSPGMFDSREVIERLDELDAMFSADGMHPEEIEERNALRALVSELEADCSDWKYGVLFVREDMFEDCARELAEEIGAIPSGYSWPASHIDWEAAADALRQDYSSVEIDGDTWYYRS